MASSKISALPAVTTPVSTDGFAVNQSGVTKLETRAQVHTLEVGEHLLLPLENDATTPTLAFGDGDSGFYQGSDNVIHIALGGATSFFLTASVFSANNGAGPGVLNEAATATNPTVVANNADPDTGLAWVSTDRGSLVAGALDCMQWEEISSARALGFYTTAPIVMQTGVAVSAGGVHAALVALGLITGP